MKPSASILAIAAVAVAAFAFTTPSAACDGVAALGTGCYSQNIRERVKVEPEYRIVERQRFVEKQYVPAERIVEREKVVVKRQRSSRVRDTLQALTAPRSKVIRSERVIERSVY